MDTHELTRTLNYNNGSKIVLVVADGLGGIPREPGGPTELEAARTPHLDTLVRDNVCGLMTPVLPGITPGSGPGHLALFGYDPLQYTIGRGALEAMGSDIELAPNDVAIRGNFCTVDDDLLITDRRAGRIPDETCAQLIDKLSAVSIEGVEVILRAGREHRFVLIFRGDGLQADVENTDPQIVGVPPRDPTPLNPGSLKTSRVAAEFIKRAREILKDERPANMITLRGFARRPPIPTIQDIYGLTPAAIAIYPMYRGLARLVGMTPLSAGTNLDTQVEAMRTHWDSYDFFFVHHKYTDSTGEDGNFDGKIERIEELDARIPAIAELKPKVLIITADHSTPAALREHSWHPVPLAIAADSCRPDAVERFGEKDCLHGGLGRFEAKYLIPVALAHAGRLQKFGA